MIGNYVGSVNRSVVIFQSNKVGLDMITGKQFGIPLLNFSKVEIHRLHSKKNQTCSVLFMYEMCDSFTSHMHFFLPNSLRPKCVEY